MAIREKLRGIRQPAQQGTIIGRIDPGVGDLHLLQIADIVGYFLTGQITFAQLATSVQIRLLPAGGTTGQVLTKINNTDYNVDWETPSGGGTGLTQPQVLLRQWMGI